MRDSNIDLNLSFQPQADHDNPETFHDRTKCMRANNPADLEPQTYSAGLSHLRKEKAADSKSSPQRDVAGAERTSQEENAANCKHNREGPDFQDMGKNSCLQVCDVKTTEVCLSSLVLMMIIYAISVSISIWFLHI